MDLEHENIQLCPWIRVKESGMMSWMVTCMENC